MQRRFLTAFLAGLVLQLGLYAAAHVSAFSAGDVEALLARLYTPILPLAEWAAQPVVAAGREEMQQIRLLGFLLAAAPMIGAVTYALGFAAAVVIGRALLAWMARGACRRHA